MNYTQSLAYLSRIQEHGAKLALENIAAIIAHLPFSLDRMRVVQIAGTNGKGSTSHFVTSILMTAGFRVGLFTSPHLQDIRERITIDKTWISEKAFAESLTATRRICTDLRRRGVIADPPTFFEHLFLASLHHFHRQEVDFAVFEVGLGGRLDATSTITPDVSVITNISRDHTKTLGRTLRDIAREKAGIIKPGVPVVCGCPPRSVSRRVIRQTALDRGAPFHPVFEGRQNTLNVEAADPYDRCTYRSGPSVYRFSVRLNGKHQTINACTAIRAVELLGGRGIEVDPDTISQGIEKNFVPGRIEFIGTHPQVILDGGHNVESIRALREFLMQKDLKNLTLIFGVLRDKNYRRMAELLLPFADTVILTEPVSNRALPAERLVRLFHDRTTMVHKNLQDAFNTARALGQRILITGSLYLAGAMRNIILGGENHG